MDLQIRSHKDQPRPNSPETCYQQFLGAESEMIQVITVITDINETTAVKTDIHETIQVITHN